MSLKKISMIFMCVFFVLNPLFSSELIFSDYEVRSDSRKLVISAANGADLIFANGVGRLQVKPNTLVGEIPNPYGIIDKAQMALLEQFVVDWENSLLKPYAFDESWNKVSSIEVSLTQELKPVIPTEFTPQGDIWVIGDHNIYTTDTAYITIPYTAAKSDDDEKEFKVFSYDSEINKWEQEKNWSMDTNTNTVTILTQDKIAAKYCVGTENVAQTKASSPTISSGSYSYDPAYDDEHFYETNFSETVDTFTGALILENRDFTFESGPLKVDFVRQFNSSAYYADYEPSNGNPYTSMKGWYYQLPFIYDTFTFASKSGKKFNYDDRLQ